MTDLIDQFALPQSRPQNPLDDYWAEKDRNAASAAMLVKSNPEQAGRANVLSRQFGLPADTVERNLGSLEEQATVRRARGIMERYPAVGAWASDPRNAAVAKDDWDSLSALGKVWRGVENTGSSLKAGLYAGTSGLWGALEGMAELRSKVDPVNLVVRAFGGEGSDYGAGFAKQQRLAGSKMADAARPQAASWLGRNALAGVESIPGSLTSVLAGLVGGPEAGLAVAGSITGGQSYGDARDKGISPLRATNYAISQGLIEAATEKIPLSRLLGDLATKTPFAKTLAHQLASEIPGEQAATLMQDLNDWAVLNPEKSFTEYLKERPERAAETLVATAVGTVGNASIGSIFKGAMKATLAATDRQGHADQAAAGGENLDKIMEAAAESKVRTRDPQSFSALLARLSAGTPVEKLFIPAEKLATYFQSNDIDHHGDPFWGSYSEQIDQGLATGGDVVVPTSEAAAHLAGTPAWDAIRGDVRTTPGGMSLSEAEQFEASKEAELEKMGAEMAAQIEADRAALEPRQKLTEAVRDKLMQAGFTPDAAALNAELVAARYATRASRLGQELTGDEADKIDVRQVLPEGLAPHVAADGLDMVIAAMKDGKEAKPNRGASLLEFIAKSGGIEDKGGDIASMGGADWHRGKPGRRKLIREALAAQGSLLGGGNERTLDAIAHSAWEAGYFPGMTERPEVNDLIDAIGSELRGEPRFAETDESTTLDTRKAAEDLRALLEQRGINPATASAKQIKDEVRKYQDEASSGGLRQSAFDGLSIHEQGLGDASLFTYREGDNAIHGVARIADGVLDVDVSGPGANELGPAFVRRATRALRDGFPEAKEIGGFRTTGARAVATDARVTLRQTYADGPRGQISFADGRAIVELFEARDLSTFVHEMGHNWLEELREDAERASATLAPEARPGFNPETFRNVVGEVPPVGEPSEGGHLTDPDYNYRSLSAGEIDAIRSAGWALPQDGARKRGANKKHWATGDGKLHYGQGHSFVRTLKQGFTDDAPIRADKIEVWNGETGQFEPLAAPSAPNVAEQSLSDWQTVQDWFAASGHPIVDGIIPTDAHEMWARGFERFVMEGKSPSTTLRRAFDAFRSWLLQIYKVVDNLRAPITPEIREVMERLIATDEEILQARQREYLTALFADAEDAGMTEGEFAEYEKTAGEAKDAAFDALLYRTMQTVRQARTKAWKDEEAGVKADVTARINRRPEFKALHLLRTGKFLDSPDAEPIRAKLDTAWLVQTYGEDVLKTLPKSVPPIFAHERSTDADSLAEMVGFRTGDEMVRTLIGLEQRQAELRDQGDKRSVKARLIDEETAAEMRDRHGDPLNDGSIEEEALAAVMNDKQGELIATELRMLQRKRRSDAPPTPYSLAKEWASRAIREGVVRDVASPAAIQRYARAAAKAAKDAEAAMLKGDVDETYRQKQKQMLNAALISEARKAGDAVDKAVSRLGKLAKRATIKSVDQDYLDQAHALLEQVEFRERSQKSIDRQESFAAWAQARQGEGHDVVVPDSFAESLGTTHWSRLSVEKLLGLDETVAQIIHLGRLKQTLIDGQEAREWQEVKDGIRGRMGEQPPLPPKANIEPGRWGKFKEAVIGVHAGLTKMGRMIFVLDGGDTNGPMHRHVWRPLASALTRENDIMQGVQQRNSESLAAVPKDILKRFGEHLSIPEMPGDGGDIVWSRSQLHQMARNAGTAENWRILCEGRGWDQVAAMAALDREMSREEWEYVQRDLDTVGSFWPEIEAMYKRINGVAPPKVDIRPIETRHGTFSGGYYPLVADSTANPALDQKLQSDELFTALYTRAVTKNGFTKERAGATYVVSLAPGISQRHVMEVVHDFTHREAVMKSDRILSDPDIIRSMREVIGVEMQQQFRPWLKAVANQWAQEKTGVEAAEKIANKMRSNMSIMGMGYRLTTMVQQLAGYANSIEALGTAGEKWFLSGMKSVAGMGPGESVRFAMDRSGVIRHRLNNVDLTQAQELEKLQGKVGIGADVRRFAFYGIGIMDRAVVIPTWHAGYNKMIAEGASEEDAIAFADHVVEASQGGAGIMNAAAIQRKKGMSSLLVMFYSYGSAYYNRQSQLVRDIKGARRASDVPRLMARTWWLMLAPNLISTLIQGLFGNGPDDDESYAGWLAMGSISGLFTGLPLVSGFASSLLRGFDYSASPLDRAGTSITRALNDLWHKVDDYLPEFVPGSDPDGGTEPSKRAVRNTVESVGYMTGLPLGTAAPAVQFVTDWANGRADPQSVGDWWEGLNKGRVKAD